MSLEQNKALSCDSTRLKENLEARRWLPRTLLLVDWELVYSMVMAFPIRTVDALCLPRWLPDVIAEDDKVVTVERLLVHIRESCLVFRRRASR